MKKWLILAAVVAMFAMVFPACGKDEGGVSVATDVIVLADNDADPTAADPTKITITWNGGNGYEYGVYYQVLDKLAPAAIIDMGLGQNVYSYSDEAVEDVDDPSNIIGALNEDKANWSYVVEVTQTAPTLSQLTTAVGDATGNEDGLIRFGVAPANPGGFPIEGEIKIVWQEGFVALTPTAAP